GQGALGSNTEGVANEALGLGTLGSNTTGNRNTAVGYAALELLNGNGNVDGSDNIAIGHLAGNALSKGSNNILIGNSGVDADANPIRIGGAQTATYVAGIRGAPAGDQLVTVQADGRLGSFSPSSRRFKQDIADMGDASSGARHLRPVTFRYKPEF